MHTIRLRGPWQLEPVERYARPTEGGPERATDGLPLRVKMTMPSDWADAFGPDFFGRVRYLRTFNKPTGLDSGERVWLVVEPPRSHGVATLNDQLLGEVRLGDSPARFEVTAMLEDHNHLEIVVNHPPLDDPDMSNDDISTAAPGGLVGEVCLEIEE